MLHNILNQAFLCSWLNFVFNFGCKRSLFGFRRLRCRSVSLKKYTEINVILLRASSYTPGRPSASSRIHNNSINRCSYLTEIWMKIHSHLFKWLKIMFFEWTEYIFAKIIKCKYLAQNSLSKKRLEILLGINLYSSPQIIIIATFHLLFHRAWASRNSPLSWSTSRRSAEFSSACFSSALARRASTWS